MTPPRSNTPASQPVSAPSDGPIEPLGLELEPSCALMRAIYISCHMMMRRLDRVAQPEGLTASRWILLVIARDAGRPMTITNLSEHLCISPQNVSRMVSSLESEGLVTRDTTGPGRTVRVSITERGLERLDACDTHADACVGGMIEGVDPGDIDQARKTLEHMIINTSAMEASEAEQQEKTR